MTTHKKIRTLASTSAALLALLLAGCGGGGDGASGLASNPNPPAQCADTGSCPESGFEVGPEPAPLCAASLDFNTVFTGGSGAGELLTMKFDTSAKTYELKIIDSPVPKTIGVVSPTRAGVTFTGTYKNLTNLLTAEQNRCALQLVTAKASDNTSQARIDSKEPPIIFLGNGVAGGGIPGATISYPGIWGIGAIPATTFNMYPVLAFAEVETDFSKVNGTFNLLGLHMVPSGGALISGAGPFTIATATATETLASNGTCTRADRKACVSTGTPWKEMTTVSAFESSNEAGKKRYPSFFADAITSSNYSSRAKGIMVVGKLNGDLVPVVIRVGYANANLLKFSIDDESGMALMAPNKALTPGELNGGYMGSGSDFKYAASLFKDSAVTLLDPLTMLATGRYEVDWTQKVPGIATTTFDSAAHTPGKLIAAGPVFAYLEDNKFLRVSVFAAH